MIFAARVTPEGIVQKIDRYVKENKGGETDRPTQHLNWDKDGGS
jgi:hypothetical protein